MNIFVQLTDTEYEQFKQFKEKPNIEDHDSAELSSALLTAIRKEGGQVDTQDSRFEFNPMDRKTSTVAKLRNSNFVITLMVEKY